VSPKSAQRFLLRFLETFRRGRHSFWQKIGLFGKRALQKRLYSAKETYTFCSRRVDLCSEEERKCSFCGGHKTNTVCFVGLFCQRALSFAKSLCSSLCVSRRVREVQCVAVCCSGFAVCCSVLQWVCSVLQCFAVGLQCFAVGLQCVAVFCSVKQTHTDRNRTCFRDVGGWGGDPRKQKDFVPLSKKRPKQKIF